ncbi:transposase [Hymenobacter sp. GOD-10R]|nr:transposase [Hymenobacter sp. GOD-10R]WRQ31308.1 transposase [Hymenobacter sp. GOD-10R]
MLDTDLTYYRRNLPHRLPPGVNLFITFRLAGSLPRAVLDNLRTEWEQLDKQHSMEDSYARQKRYFGRFDKLLDQASIGPTWLDEPTVAGVVAEALHYYDDCGYHLVCYCIMPNHVHLVATLPDASLPLLRTLQSIKSYSATKCNALLGRSGQFWQRESYDHLIRDAGEMERIISYVLENPVKARLTDDWQLWPHTYWHEL